MVYQNQGSMHYGRGSYRGGRGSSTLRTPAKERDLKPQNTTPNSSRPQNVSSTQNDKQITGSNEKGRDTRMNSVGKIDPKKQGGGFGGINNNSSNNKAASVIPVKAEAKTPDNQSKNDRKRGQQNDSNRGKEKEKHEKHQKDRERSAKGDKISKDEFKLGGRNRLFVGNLQNDCSEEEFKSLFNKYGPTSEVYCNPSRGFGFVRYIDRLDAEFSKSELDGLQYKGRMLRVRFAAHGGALRVKHLPLHVSNELLEEAFCQFGTIEKAIVIVDDKGKTTGEGIVEFARKPGAQQAYNKINEGVFVMGATPRPIAVEFDEQKDDIDGMPDKFILKNQQVLKERETAPHFAERGSFEWEFSQKWKELYRLEGERREELKRNMEEAVQKLEMEQESALFSYQTELMRRDVESRQRELRRMEEQMQRRSMNSGLGNHSGRINQAMDDQEMRLLQEEEVMRRQMEVARQMGGPDDYRSGRGDMSAPMQPPQQPSSLMDRQNQGNQGKMNSQKSHQGNMGYAGTNSGSLMGQYPGGNSASMADERNAPNRQVKQIEEPYFGNNKRPRRY